MNPGKIVKLGEYVEILSGYAFKSSYFNENQLGIPLIRIRDVFSNNLKTFYSGEYKEEYVVKKGDLLITMDGEFKIKKWEGESGLLNQRICKIISSHCNLETDYLLYLLPAILKKIEDRTPFVTVKHLSVKAIKESIISLPDIETQRKIVMVLKLIQDIMKKRQSQITALDELAHSLFLDKFGDPKTKESIHSFVKLSEVSTKITDGTHHSPPMVNKGVPYVSAKHLGKGHLDFHSNPSYISEEDHIKIFKRCDPKKGDVLYIKDGATTGIAGINYYDFEFSMLSSLALIKPDLSRLNNYYLVYYLNNPRVKENILNQMNGGAIKRLTIKKINNIEVLLPPIELQNNFMTSIKKIEEQKILYKKSLNQLRELYNSSLQKALQGELFQEK